MNPSSYLNRARVACWSLTDPSDIHRDGFLDGSRDGELAIRAAMDALRDHTLPDKLFREDKPDMRIARGIAAQEVMDAMNSGSSPRGNDAAIPPEVAAILMGDDDSHHAVVRASRAIDAVRSSLGLARPAAVIPAVSPAPPYRLRGRQVDL
jgi:hypothetical protein